MDQAKIDDLELEITEEEVIEAAEEIVEELVSEDEELSEKKKVKEEEIEIKADDDEDDDEDDDDVKEGFSQPTDGVMSKKVVPQTKKPGKCGIEKHGNSAPHLDDKIKGKAKYARYPKGKSAEKHGNAAPGLKDEYKKGCEGRDKNLGTTD